LAFAALDGIPVDLEMVYVASLLHDLHAELPTPERCFAVVGAERAEQFALEHGADPPGRGGSRRGSRGESSKPAGGTTFFRLS
jgi:hypothetical protein